MVASAKVYPCAHLVRKRVGTFLVVQDHQTGTGGPDWDSVLPM